MAKWVLYSFLMLPVVSFSQIGVASHISNPDTSFYAIYENTDDGVSFIYPKNRSTENRDEKIIFRATEEPKSANDQYMETIYLGRIFKIKDLSKFINNSPNGFTHKKKYKIKVIQKEVKKIKTVCNMPF